MVKRRDSAGGQPPAQHTERAPSDNVVRLPSSGDSPGVPQQDPVAADASAPDVLDLRAEQRDAAAAERDRAAVARAVREMDRPAADQLTEIGMLAARDRAAAALDREEAALDRRRAAEYLNRTYRDSLTGALQRVAGRDQLAHEVDRAHRSGGALVVVFLDVVGLKEVNDRHGHGAGDALLRAVGAALTAGLRSYDVVVRYGGDEFVCAMPNSSLESARERFVEVSGLLMMTSPGARFSIGLAALQPEESLDEVIRRADRQLYDGRRLPGGPGRIVSLPQLDDGG